MKLHRNAKTTPTSRLELVRRTVDDGWRYQAVAEGYGVSVRPTPARPAAVAAVLQSRPATRESELSTTVITATECCLMNNVFDFNN